MTDRTPIPFMEIIARMTNQTVDEVYEWDEKTWLDFADKLIESDKKDSSSKEKLSK